MRAKRNALSAAVLVMIGMAGLFSVSTARATQTGDTDFGYTGNGTSSKLIFGTGLGVIDGQFTVPGEVVLGECIPLLPPFEDDCIIDVFPGQVAFKMKLELVTTAEVSSPNHFHVEGPDDVVEGDTVPIISTNVAQDGDGPEFKLKAGPKFTIHYDYDPDESGMECADYGQTDTGDNTCDDIVFEPGQATLMSKNLTVPYNGPIPLEEDTDLFSIPVCKLIGDLIGLGALTDVCDVSVNSEVNATLDASAITASNTANDVAVLDPGFHAVRDLLVGGNPLGGTNAAIHWPSPNQVIDNVTVQCGANPGSSVSYRLTENSYDLQVRDITAGFEVKLKFKGVLDFLDDVTLLDLGDLFDLTAGGEPIGIQGSAVDYQVGLGKYIAEQIPPDIASHGGAPDPGTEGSPVTFSATATDNCPGALSYRWDFSDGGVAFGATTSHTFADNGNFTYQLSVRDLRGNTAIANGSEQIDNATPVANAGPDAIDAWGRDIPFNGQAVDPGAGDQSTLSYEWDFGDNSPKGHAKDVMHAYTTPGSYTATLKVCDKDGACDTDSRDVTIRKRNTSLGYIGAHTWTYDTQVHLSGSLVDEFGQVVNGRQVDFSIDGGAASSANTDSVGIADRTYQVSQAAGNHAVGANFAGDALYSAASSTDASVVVLKPTSVVYTGSLTGGPNKTITLSAVLKDSEGKPLAGRQIDFVLGAQTASAITDANGIATTTLKLSQKNGTYNLTATFAPAGTDTGKYAGSSTVTTFKLQAK